MRQALEQMEPRLLTAKEAARYLRISLFTLNKIEKAGLIQPYRTPGGHRRYSIEMLQAYLEKSREQPAHHNGKDREDPNG